jgi:2-dehydro-3-deoxygluconokinase
LMQQDGLVAQAVTEADVIYVSGISIAILDEVGRTALLDTLMVARTNGAKIAFDPNLRPRLWVNTTAMCAVVMEFAAISDIVFPSHDEEAIYFGDANIAATKARYQNVGCTTIIVKNGGGEITFHADGHAGVFTPEMAKTVHDTTAAGDSFNAGYLAADGPAATRVAAGCALAGRVIQGAGALVTGAAHAI